MAREDEEDIIIIEDADAAGEPTQPSDDIASLKQNLDTEEKYKRIMMLVGGGIILLLVLFIIILVLQKGTAPKQQLQPLSPIEKKLSLKSTPSVPPSQVEQMIAKANYLYNSNNKQEALHLYEQIAHYNQALSEYNLGVAQLKGKHYKQAFATFQKAISNNEKVCESAINAAVCALHLKQKASFEYYINLAYAYLPNEVNSPLYSYYYALIKYYQGHYIEALSALKHPTSKYYYTQQQYLKSKLDSLFGNYNDALDATQNASKEANPLTQGLLYANIGNYTLAQKYLSQGILQQQNPLRGGLALALVNLKAGYYEDAVKELKDITTQFPKKVYTIYPIKVLLKKTIFSPFLAQAHYKKMLNNSTAMTYAQIFYFAPYKIFNANNTLNYIRRGNANIYLNDISSATNYLKEGRSLSAVNFVIAQAIKEALSYKLRDANNKLRKAAKQEPQNSILQYNLALTYAQLGDIKNAYKHFTSAYYLDAKNYLAGIFALMSAQLLHKDNQHFNTLLKENLLHATNTQEHKLYTILLDIASNNLIGGLNWLQGTTRKQPLDLILKVIIAKKLGKHSIALEASKQLSALLPKTILPQLIYIDTKLAGEPKLKYIRDTLFFMQKQKFTFNDLYYGSAITRYLYTYQALFTGTLYPLQQHLQDMLNNTKHSALDITYTLALVDLFHKDYEESYLLFNQLIDTYHVKNAQTLFLGAVASIAAGHHANAIALLELATLTDSNNSESHYALGLLYLEAKNNLGAAIEFNQIHTPFQSEYFDFSIDLKKLSH